MFYTYRNDERLPALQPSACDAFPRTLSFNKHTEQIAKMGHPQHGGHPRIDHMKAAFPNLLRAGLAADEPAAAKA